MKNKRNLRLVPSGKSVKAVVPVEQMPRVEAHNFGYGEMLLEEGVRTTALMVCKGTVYWTKLSTQDIRDQITYLRKQLATSEIEGRS